MHLSTSPKSCPVHFLRVMRQLDHLIGNTRLHKLDYAHGDLYTKLESQNFFGSIKDRPAYFILKKAIESQLIDENSAVVESTSGNFGIALACICRALRIKFVSVIDPNISAEKEKILSLNGAEIIKVTERDETGGYLLNRIATVKDYIRTHENSYTPNQYGNPNNYLSYYHTLGAEIGRSMPHLDFAFISVSTGGTIAGLSHRLKEHFKGIRIIAVDVEGSMIFDNKPALRKITGMGASMRTELVDKALIDDVVILSQREIIKGCRELLSEHGLFLGASSGAAYAAASRWLKKPGNRNRTSLFISPDAGSSYIDTIFDQGWVNENIDREIH